MLAALAPVSATASEEGFRSSVRPLSPAYEQMLRGRFWRPGCPVPLSGLRVLRVRHFDFAGEVQTGQLVVGRDVARPLVSAFRRLYELRFPIRHMTFRDMYGPEGSRPRDLDITAAFECRQAVPSPCTGGRATGTWSNHAYGHAIDINPRENPYVGCGMTRDPAARKYRDRSRLRRGMVTPAVVEAFRSIGWGWGGDWTGATKDYMHFSVNGH